LLISGSKTIALYHRILRSVIGKDDAAGHNPYSTWCCYVTGMVQQTDYYPFGMVQNPQTVNNDNKYLYNGKELQDDMNLTWLDYGARMYDPQIGRWHSVDLLAEVNRKWSPYRYAYNNPLRFIDPDGMFEDGFTIDNWGYILPVDNTGGDDYDVLYDEDNYNNGARDYNETGNDGQGIKVDKGVLENNTEYTKTEFLPSENKYKTVIINEYSVQGEGAVSLYEFMAKYASFVEFSNVKVGNGTSYITTSHEPGVEGGMANSIYSHASKENPLIMADHSHPGNSGPSPADTKVAEDALKIYNQAIFRVYKPGNGEYIPYRDAIPLNGIKVSASGFRPVSITPQPIQNPINTKLY
jgi:RHS repeat-associated protein